MVVQKFMVRSLSARQATRRELELADMEEGTVRPEPVPTPTTQKDGEEPAQGSANIPDEIVLKQDTVAKLKNTFKGLIWDNLDGATTKFALRPLPLEFKCNKNPKLSTQWKYPMEWFKPLWLY